MPNKIHFNFNSLKKIKAPGLSECFSAWYRWTIYRERSNQMLRIIKKKKKSAKIPRDIKQNLLGANFLHFQT